MQIQIYVIEHKEQDLNLHSLDDTLSHNTLNDQILYGNKTIS